MPENAFNLDAYLKRIGYSGPRVPTREVLDGVHLAHATHIPFENLDILLGRGILLDSRSLQAKLVHNRRGGYCFEQNLLLAEALELLGFTVTRLAARVRWGAEKPRPRTHMLLRVDLDGLPFLADVGFGGWGLLRPIPLVPDREDHQFSWPYRLAEEAEVWVLQALLEGAWTDLYSFTMEPQLLVDYELASYFVSTHPTSPFTRIIIAQRPSPQSRAVLRDRELTVTSPDGTTTRTIADDHELPEVLSSVFGLDFPPETRFQPGAGESPGPVSPQ
jgi:N-hydroxyarylamine O-acetyltransferase